MRQREGYMKAVTVAPGTAGSARLKEVPEPDPARVLAAADRSWLEQLVTRRVRPDQVQQALARAPADIKVVMDFAPP
jgi:glucose 1-dehydrogenase